MMLILILVFNGEVILLKNMCVIVFQQFQDKDQFGQISVIIKLEQGVKGKELCISGEIFFKNLEILKCIFELVSVIDVDGKCMKYCVVYEVVRVVNFCEVIFSGMLDVLQQDGKMVWLVMFILVEYVSVQEKWEVRVIGKIMVKKQMVSSMG